MTADELPKIKTTAVGETGIGIVQEIIMNAHRPGLGWVFRALPTSDVGIDGQIEVVKRMPNGDAIATGRIISAQIKTGASYFKEDKGDHWIVRIAKSTVAYWRAHSVPVILILVDPKSRRCYWARGDGDMHSESPKTLGILVPKSQVLDDRAGPALQQLAENAAPAGIRLARLEGDAPLMARLKAGERIFVSADRWVNKSSGRMDVSLGTYVERPRTVGTFTHTTTEFEATEQFLSIGFTSWEEMVQRQFPWAKAVPDEFAEPDEDDLYDAYLAETGAWDSEDKVYIDVRGEFKQYRRAALRRWRSGIVEENDNGEIDTYRMELTLNALGRSFLRLRQYLQHGSTPVSPA